MASPSALRRTLQRSLQRQRSQSDREIRRSASCSVNESMETNACVLCGESSLDVPLLTFEYQGGTFRICSQHLPVLIHDPAQLAGWLPGAEKLRKSKHED